MSLTFDDGPTSGLTEQIADLLAAHGHRATFFVLVPLAEAQPHIVSRLRDLGHEVGLHGVRHVHTTSLSRATTRSDLADGRDRLATLGVRPVLFRPPGGAQSRSTYLLARGAGLRVVAWTADPQDYLDLEEDALRSRLDEGIRPGRILLQHDGQGHLPDVPLTTDQSRRRLRAVEICLALLAERGLMSVTVSDLIGTGARTARWLS